MVYSYHIRYENRIDLKIRKHEPLWSLGQEYLPRTCIDPGVPLWVPGARVLSKAGCLSMMIHGVALSISAGAAQNDGSPV